jgi:universal stress protein A
MAIQRILVPTDGSELSLRAAEMAAELARGVGARITLLTAVEPPEATRAYISADALAAVEKGLRGAAEAMLENAATRVRRVHPEVDLRVAWNAPVNAITAEARQGYDLIVMGSRGLGMEPSDRHLLGSVAERVIRRADCPVLIVPAAESA